MARNNRITLFDLQFASGCTTSPYVWRTKYALAHKGFDIDLVPGGFVGILDRTGGRSDRLPVIVDDDRWVLDSVVIADYLDETYPERPLLFPNPASRAVLRFVDNWIWSTVIDAYFENYIADYHDLSLPGDQPYVRETREKFVGNRPLEVAQAGREDRLPLMPPRFEPLRKLLSETPWIGGDAPDYADFSALGIFLWLASIARTPPFTHDDPMRDWLDRGFDLFGGLGRHPGLNTLFGLQLRPGDPEPFVRNGLGQQVTPTNQGPGAPVEPQR
ncbi:MAG: glutathione S-transferase N-terminal domain-containing protein [Sphingomonas sp.]|nr:glutathione S-transferase N-terminal domain-containing protein [Sphingomonas sp.]